MASRESRPKRPTDAVLGKEEVKGPIRKGIDSLVSEVKESGLGDKFPITVREHLLWFRLPSNSDDVSRMRSEGLEFLMMIRDRKQGKPPAFTEALSIRELTDEDLIVAFMVHYWSHEDEKISLPQALTLTAYNPMVMVDLLNQIDRVIHGNMSVLSFGKVMSEKKDSETPPRNISAQGRRQNTSKSSRTS